MQAEFLYYLYDMLKRAHGRPTHPPPKNVSWLINHVRKCQRDPRRHIIALSGMVSPLAHHYRVPHDDFGAFQVQTLDLEALQGLDYNVTDSEGGFTWFVYSLSYFSLPNQDRTCIFDTRNFSPLIQRVESGISSPSAPMFTSPLEENYFGMTQTETS